MGDDRRYGTSVPRWTGSLGMILSLDDETSELIRHAIPKRASILFTSYGTHLVVIPSSPGSTQSLW